MSEPADDPLAIGTRLIVGHHRATVRYVGQVDNQTGTWVGLEWDDPTRGKHDGTHGGKRYFTCSRHHTLAAATFVRLHKLFETADFGRTLDSAIQERYKDHIPSTGSNTTREMVLVGAGTVAAALSQDGLLHQASFISMRIVTLHPTPFVTSFLRNVENLDLSGNLLGRWSTVAQLLASLPRLTTLNLSDNLLDFSDAESDSGNDNATSSCSRKTTTQQQQLPRLRTLVLNSCGVSWQEIVTHIGPQCPHLSALHLVGNNITTLSGSTGNRTTTTTTTETEVLAKCFPCLELLDVEHNALSNWNEDIAGPLHALPCLTSLLLSGNTALRDITYAPYQGFATLRSMMLAETGIDSWQVVDELHRFPGLHEVRLSATPLSLGVGVDRIPVEEVGGEGAKGRKASNLLDNVRYEMVGRMGNVTVLNGSMVQKEERWDSELAYLRKITDALAEAGLSLQEKEVVLNQHPRYVDLVAKYGTLSSSHEDEKGGNECTTTSSRGRNEKNRVGAALSRSMVELRVVVYGEQEQEKPEKEIIKKVPATLTVGRLKPLIERLLRLRLTATHRVTLSDPEKVIVEDITCQDGRELRYYEVENGWIVEIGVGVGENGLEGGGEDGRQREEQERRMEAHERGLQALRAEEERLMLGGVR